MRNINDNAVQGRLSKNYLTRKIIAWNISDTKYSRFTVPNLGSYVWADVFVFGYSVLRFIALI